MIATLNEIIGFVGGLTILAGVLFLLGVLWAKAWTAEHERNPWLDRRGR